MGSSPARKVFVELVNQQMPKLLQWSSKEETLTKDIKPISLVLLTNKQSANENETILDPGLLLKSLNTSKSVKSENPVYETYLRQTHALL